MRRVVQTVSGVANSPAIPMDHRAQFFNVGIEAIVTGTATYNVQFTLDDIYSSTPPTWFNVASPFTGATANQVGNLLIPTAAMRLNVTAVMAAPVQSATSTSTTGGTLAAGTYFYKVTALNAAGETVGSNEQSQVTTGTTSTVTVSWGAVTGATSYRVYRGTATNAENVFYAVAGGATVTFTDTGAASTAGTPPSTNTAGSVTLTLLQSSGQG